jgi:hypothetical protein
VELHPGDLIKLLERIEPEATDRAPAAIAA